MATEGLWYHDSFLVDGLAEALTNADVFQSASDVLAFRKKPQKYREFYEAWEEADFPSDADDDGWDEFEEAVASEENESDDT